MNEPRRLRLLIVLHWIVVLLAAAAAVAAYWSGQSVVNFLIIYLVDVPLMVFNVVMALDTWRCLRSTTRRQEMK
jgi:fatty acid desaturase